jgi:hypothetical protein
MTFNEFVMTLGIGLAIGISIGTFLGVIVKFDEFNERLKKLEEKK